MMSNLHSDTQECLPKVCRLSGFVPTNIPIIIMISILPQTTFITVAGQSINQTYNFAFNYANRNASNSFNNTQLALAYSGAVGCAVGVSLGLPKVVAKMPLPPTLKSFFTFASPFFGIVSANIFNLAFARFKDFSSGINVQAVLKDGSRIDVPDKSINAAKQAFILTGIIRASIPIAVFFGPNLTVKFLKNFNLYPKSSFGLLLVNTAISGFYLYFALSLCISFYPQYIQLNKEKLESNFQNLIINDQKIEKFVYNKGL